MNERMTRAMLSDKLRQYADAQYRADNAETNEEWQPLSDEATGIAVGILNEFDRLTAEVERMRPVFEAAMQWCGNGPGGYWDLFDVCSDASKAAKETMEEPTS